MDLVVELKKRHQLYIGTVRKKRKFLPPIVVDMKRELSHASQFASDNVNKISITSYVPKKNRFVLLLGSAHMDRRVDETQKSKPSVILDYNRTKGEVDLADRMIDGSTNKPSLADGSIFSHAQYISLNRIINTSVRHF